MSRRGEDGMVTAETAAVLPVLAVVLSFALWAVSAASAQVRCADAAREAARAAARGDPGWQVRQVALRTAPPHASVSVLATGDEIEVRVAASVRWLGRGSVSETVSASAVAALEPDGPVSQSGARTVVRQASG